MPVNLPQTPAIQNDSGSPRLVLRADIGFQRLEETGRRGWVAHDPLANQFYSLSDHERDLLARCDGNHDVAEILADFTARHPDLHLTADQLVAFLASAVQKGLLVRRGVSTPIRRDENAPRRSPWSFNPLAIRLPGIDPTPLLDRLYPRVRWLFHPLTLVCLAALVVWGAIVAMIHLEEIARETPVATRWFTPQVLGTLWITLAVTKVVHELFHALVCRHFGGRCREMGMMFLVFAPTLYCDVSDAWMFRSRTGRILVSAAGVLAELVLAAIAVLLWTVAPPGLLRSLLMSVMVVCSVSTLFVNANPLLGFDGYFLLSDAIAIPNLAARAFGWWRDRIQGWLLDLPTDRTDSTPRERWILPTYALTSGLYRMFVSVLIVVTLSRGLFQAGLESVGGLLTWMVCLGWGVSPVAMTWRIAKDSRLRRLVDPGRLATGGLVWLCLLILALLVPLPRRVGAVCVLESAGAQSVFAGVEGEVASAIPPGTQVGKGDEILRLRDLRIELNRSRLETEEQVLQQRLIGVRLQRADQPDLAALVPVLEESLAGVRKQLALARLEEQNLVVRSPGAGRVQEAPRKPQRADSTEGEEASLETWRGSPLDSENRGCHLERGELCCQVGSDSLEATLLVNQADVDLLRVGQTVEVRTGARLQFRLTGQVVAIGQSPIAELPMELATTAAIPARPQAGRNAVPLEPHYQVRVEFEDPQIPVSRGTTGSARVKVAWASAWRQVLDLLRRTLRVDL